MRRRGFFVRRQLAWIGTFLVCASMVVALTANIGGAAGASHHRASASTPITWLAAGDSYSSGEGLTKTSGVCERGDAYPLQAYSDLRKVMPTLQSPNFTACGGSVIANFFNSADSEHLPMWRPAGTRYDLVTFTLGGNTLDFSGVLEQCVLGQFKSLHPAAPGHKCPTDAWLRQQIAQKIGAPYVAFLHQVASEAVVSGGNVVVLGYPDLMSLPTTWPAADRSAGSCSGISEADATQLRGDAGDLNATIGHDVAVVNAEHVNGVHLSFLPVNTGAQVGPVAIPHNDPYLFEPTGSGSHNLCGAGAAWLNGIVASNLDRSFHPGLAGNVGEGHLLAQVLPHLTWP